MAESIAAAAEAVRRDIDALIAFLTPLMPIINCHMVDSVTQQHHLLLPQELLEEIEKETYITTYFNFSRAVNNPEEPGTNQMAKWVMAARAVSLRLGGTGGRVMGERRMSALLHERGAPLPTEPERFVEAYMNNKKSYEVPLTERLWRSVSLVSGAAAAAEAGGGRGAAAAALAARKKVRVLSLECQPGTVETAQRTSQRMQEQFIAAYNNMRAPHQRPQLQERPQLADSVRQDAVQADLHFIHREPIIPLPRPDIFEVEEYPEEDSDTDSWEDLGADELPPRGSPEREGGLGPDWALLGHQDAEGGPPSGLPLHEVAEKARRTLIKVSNDAKRMLELMERVRREAERSPEVAERYSREAEKVAQDAERILQEAESLRQEAETITQEAKRVPEESERMRQDSERVTQQAERVRRDSERVAGETSRVYQDSKQLARDAVGGRREVARPPQVVDRVPQVVDGVPQVVDGVPQVVDGVPQVEDGVLQVVDRVLQLMDGVAQVVDRAPQVVDRVPQVVDTLPVSAELVPNEVQIVCQEQIRMASRIQVLKMVRREGDQEGRRRTPLWNRLKMFVPRSHDYHKVLQAFVSKETPLPELMAEAFPDLPAGVKFLVAGLHTCGNLTHALCQLFSATPSAVALAVTPCCHHLTTEPGDDGSKDLFYARHGEGMAPPPEPGFPASEHLKDFRIGRAARMLASRCAAREAAAADPPPRSLGHRALIQELIESRGLNGQELFAAARRGGRGAALRRMNAEKTYRDYLLQANQILDLGLGDDLAVRRIARSQFWGFEGERIWRRVSGLHIARAALAPAVESLLLLDQLLALLERGHDAYLTRTFDPLRSPRCYTIVAFKRQ